MKHKLELAQETRDSNLRFHHNRHCGKVYNVSKKYNKYFLRKQKNKNNKKKKIKRSSIGFSNSCPV